MKEEELEVEFKSKMYNDLKALQKTKSKEPTMMNEVL